MTDRDAALEQSVRDRLAQLERENAALREAHDHVLDHRYTTSCGHTWSMRHTACPECFIKLGGDLRAEVERAFRAGYESHRTCGQYIGPGDTLWPNETEDAAWSSYQQEREGERAHP